MPSVTRPDPACRPPFVGLDAAPADAVGTAILPFPLKLLECRRPSISWRSSPLFRCTAASRSCCSGFRAESRPTLSVAGALDSLCAEVNALFGTRRVSVWIHYRRARELALSASSDRDYAAAGTRVLTESDTIPARGLRLDSPQFLTPAPDGERILVAPLRGWRRALGTRRARRRAATTSTNGTSSTRSTTSGVQFSFALENVQLLEEVLQQRRLLEDTFNSLIDLVVVTDNGHARRPDE